MTTKKTAIVSEDVDALSPEPDVITLSSGFEVRIEPLKTRGMFKLLKIVTRGGGPILMQMPLNFNDTEVFVGQLLGVIVMAIPEAEDEALEFIRFMTTPVGVDENARSKSPEEEKNRELFTRLGEELSDPEIDDTISIIEKIVRNEAGDIQALGKRLMAIFKTVVPSAVAKN
jgi:hypothetical protein